MFIPRHAAYAAVAASLIGLSALGFTACAAAAPLSTISVDGSVVVGSFTTTCDRQGDAVSLSMEDANNANYGDVQALVLLHPAGTVVSVTVVGTHGSANDAIGLGYNAYMHNGSATVTKSGDTYTVTGATNGTSTLRNKTFAITFACPR